MLGHERLQLADQCRVPAQREVRVDPILERREPLLLEPPDLALRERLIGEVRQWWPAPQGERDTQLVTRQSRIAGLAARARPSPASSSNRSRSNLPARDLEQVPRARE